MREQFEGHARARVAIDGGQSVTKVRYRAEDGSASEMELPGLRTDLPLLPQLADAARTVHARFGPFGTVTFGVTGLTEPDRDPGVILAAAHDAGIRRVGLAHDSVTAYLATLGTDPGIVIASGTGVVTFAAGPVRTARVDGWGHIMGDAGSGYWIGREALDAVMRAHDGRGPATALSDAVRTELGDLESAYIVLQGDDARVSRVAAFARTTAELADEDEVARGILEHAARELALSASTAWERVADGAIAPRVRTLGGVFRGRVLAEAFARTLRERHPDADIGHGTPHALDGVEALADLPDDGPFAPHVRWARGLAATAL